MDGGSDVCSAYFVGRLLLGGLDLSSDMVILRSPQYHVLHPHAHHHSNQSSHLDHRHQISQSHAGTGITLLLVNMFLKPSWPPWSPWQPSNPGAGLAVARLWPARMGWSSLWLDLRWLSSRGHCRHHRKVGSHPLRFFLDDPKSGASTEVQCRPKSSYFSPSKCTSRSHRYNLNLPQKWKLILILRHSVTLPLSWSPSWRWFGAA